MAKIGKGVGWPLTLTSGRNVNTGRRVSMKRVGYAIVIVALVGFVWFGRGGQGQDPETKICADMNGDRSVDISDAIYLLQNLFTGGPSPRCLATCEPPLEDVCGVINHLQQVVGESGVPLENRFVNEGQPDAVAPGMVHAGFYAGLDGDLLDGRHGADFALVAHSHPDLARADHTHPEIIAEINALKQRVHTLEGILSVEKQEVLGRLTIGATSQALDISGDVHLTGELAKDVTLVQGAEPEPRGTILHATPIAFGSINADGTLAHATPNVSCELIGSRYYIGVGINFAQANLISVVTPSELPQGGFAHAATRSGGRLEVIIFDSNDALTLRDFQFVVYQPNP
jgi:hypothetical protein